MTRTTLSTRPRTHRIRLAAVGAATLLATALGSAPADAVTPWELAGAWGSPAGGERTHPREIHFDASGSYRVDDLVSPCPPRVVCIWSGITHAEGTYRIEGDTVLLTYAEGGTVTGPLPQELRFRPEDRTLTEQLPSGGRTVYTRLKTWR
ncbi:hypothetical protein [Streptomyces sp. NPDC050504]|uniref:hypothetical protein n=1 Tax=Streptomyces sp. NPDC050504 TaxID=3365618 RepID=UPI0037BAC07A